MIPELKAAFDQARTVALLTHVSADGDAFGSTLALMHVLQACGKQVVFYCNDTPADLYAFLPGINKIAPLPNQLDDFDLVVALDAADLNRLGACAAVLKHGRETVCIDHHGTNPGYAQYNWVNPDACATCEVLYDLLAELNYPIDDTAALCLFCGISTDTNHFSYNSVSAHTFEVASRLRGTLDLNEMTRALYRSRSLGKTRLIGRMLSEMQLYFDGKVALLTCEHSICQQLGADPSDYEGIINYGIETQGVVIAVLARTTAQPGVVKVSLRSAEGYDVAALAASFGGGGHRLAAGCTIFDSALPEAARLLIEAAGKTLEAKE
jgi:phosphoesterase RecJ-like protein